LSFIIWCFTFTDFYVGESSLNLMNKSYSFMMNNPLNVLLSSIC
jgi:hypothetical protein